MTKRVFAEMRKVAREEEASAFAELTQQEMHVLQLVAEGKAPVYVVHFTQADAASAITRATFAASAGPAMCWPALPVHCSATCLHSRLPASRRT